MFSQLQIYIMQLALQDCLATKPTAVLSRYPVGHGKFQSIGCLVPWSGWVIRGEGWTLEMG